MISDLDILRSPALGYTYLQQVASSGLSLNKMNTLIERKHLHSPFEYTQVNGYYLPCS